MTFQFYPGAAPGSEHATQIEVSRPGKTARILRNVTVPTLTVYAPPAGKANGVGVIIAPGGGFHILSIDNEGTALGQWFAELGVTPEGKDSDRWLGDFSAWLEAHGWIGHR